MSLVTPNNSVSNLGSAVNLLKVDAGVKPRLQSSKLIFTVAIKEPMRPFVLCFGNEHFCRAIQVVSVGFRWILKFLTRGDPMLFEHGDEQFGIYKRASVEETHRKTMRLPSALTISFLSATGVAPLFSPSRFSPCLATEPRSIKSSTVLIEVCI